MKKFYFLFHLMVFSLCFSQTYFVTDVVGDSNINVPIRFLNTHNGILASGFIGGNISGLQPVTFVGGNSDGILIQLDSSSGNINWIKQFAGLPDEQVLDATTDNLGNIYLIGYFIGIGSNACDVDPGAGVYNLRGISALPSRDMFIVKLDASGNFLWAQQISNPSGATHEDGTSIELDSTGNIYITGNYNYADFDPGLGTRLFTSSGGGAFIDGFILKLDNNGNFQWVNFIEGSGHKKITDMVLDSTGNIYITGYFTDTVDIDPSSNVSSRTTMGGEDIFIGAYDSNGLLLWGDIFGSTGKDIPYCLTIEGSNLFVGGEFSNSLSWGGSNTITSLGGTDGFVLKYDLNGSFITNYSIGSTNFGSEFVNDIKVFNGNVYIAGTFFDSITLQGSTYNSAGNEDIYYIELSIDLAFSSVYLIQGPDISSHPAIAHLDNGIFIGAGAFKDYADFDFTAGVDNISTLAQKSIFFTQFDFANLGVEGVTPGTEKLTLYPNPASDYVSFKLAPQASKILIYNSEGKVIFRKEGIQNHSINISFLPQGVYMMQIIDSNNKTYTEKLIKQ